MKNRKTSFVPRVVFSLMSASVVPALACGSSGDDDSGKKDSGADVTLGVFAVACCGYDQFAVADIGFGKDASDATDDVVDGTSEGG